MKRWLWIPLAMVALVVATPSSEAGCRKKGCASDCGPSQTIVGYRTEIREVTVCEYVTEKRPVRVTEYQTVTEKREVTRQKPETVTETKPYTFTTTERVTEARTESVWVCRPVTTEEERSYVVHNRVEEKKKGTRRVSRPTTVEELRKVTVDQGAYETRMVEQVCNSSNYNSCRKSRKRCCGGGCDSGYDTSCAVSTVVCEQRVWVPKLVTREEKVKVTKYEMVEEAYDYVAVNYVPETKKEKVKVTRYERVQEKQTFNVVVCRPKTVTENRTYTSTKWTPVKEMVDVRVCRPITVEKVIDVRVARHVKKNVEVKVPIYGEYAPIAGECAPAKCCK